MSAPAPRDQRREHVVAIGDQCRPVGVLQFTSLRGKQVSTFRYLREWIEDPTAFALSPSLPLGEQRSHFAGLPDDPSACLPGVVSDCSPDSWGRSIIERGSGRTLDELEYLLAVDDDVRHGALRLLDAEGVPLARGSPPTPRVVDLARLRDRHATLEQGLGDAREIALELMGASSPLGGARPKSVVVGEDGTQYVAKYTMPADTMPIERVEVATLALARDVGIRAARARLALPDSVRPIALIERFDRGPGGAGRIHYASAQTFVDARRGEPRFYTDIAEALRTACRTDVDAQREMAELHRRILFTILVCNTDDHLRNHGLLHVGDGSWMLSPGFDINPQPRGPPRLKTGISELSGFEPTVEGWVEAAPFFEVSEDEAQGIAATMAERIAGAWRERLREHGLTAAQCEEYAPAFEHGQARFALGLGGSG